RPTLTRAPAAILKHRAAWTERYREDRRGRGQLDHLGFPIRSTEPTEVGLRMLAFPPEQASRMSGHVPIGPFRPAFGRGRGSRLLHPGIAGAGGAATEAASSIAGEETT